MDSSLGNVRDDENHLINQRIFYVEWISMRNKGFSLGLPYRILYFCSFLSGFFLLQRLGLCYCVCVCASVFVCFCMYSIQANLSYMQYAIQCLWHFVWLEFIFISLSFLFYIFLIVFLFFRHNIFSMLSWYQVFFFFGIIVDMRGTCVCTACKVLHPLIIYSALFFEEKCV